MSRDAKRPADFSDDESPSTPPPAKRAKIQETVEAPPTPEKPAPSLSDRVKAARDKLQNLLDEEIKTNDVIEVSSDPEPDYSWDSAPDELVLEDLTDSDYEFLGVDRDDLRVIARKYRTR